MTLLERDETGDWPEIVIPNDGPKATARRILREVAAKHGIPVSVITGDFRFRPVVRCRREIACRIAVETNLSLPQIADLLCKDHTTVLWTIRRHNEATGENIRGFGGITPARVLRQLTYEKRCKRKPRTREDKLRRSRRRQAWVEATGMGAQ